MILAAILIIMALLAGSLLSSCAEPVPDTQEERDQEMRRNDGLLFAVTVLGIIALLMVFAGMGAAL